MLTIGGLACVALAIGALRRIPKRSSAVSDVWLRNRERNSDRNQYRERPRWIWPVRW